MTSRLVRVAAIGAGTLATDQAMKWLILTQIMQPPRVVEVTPFFNLTLGFNTGVSFGMLSETFAAWPEFLGFLNLGIVVVILVWALRTHSAVELAGLSLMAGGALGNIIDRWQRGAVVDFLDFHWQGWHWPTFNGADVFISFGVFLLLLTSLKPVWNTKAEPQV